MPRMSLCVARSGSSFALHFASAAVVFASAADTASLSCEFPSSDRCTQALLPVGGCWRTMCTFLPTSSRCLEHSRDGSLAEG